MKIALEKIKDEPISISEDIAASAWDLDKEDIKFIGNIHIDCSFLKIHQEILVKTSVITKREITCSRCLSKLEQIQKQEFEKSYDIGSLKDELDLDSDIREEVLLNFPMKVLCRDDCRGICGNCGKNLNEGSCSCSKLENVTGINIDIKGI